MGEENKPAFPMLPAKHWWLLRRRFKQSIPGTVTDNYLSTVLEMEVKSARANVLPYLVSMGIIDEDGKTLDRAKHWRDDLEYPKVCDEILEDVYPRELLDTFQGQEIKPEAITRWFSNHTGAGDSAVRRMVGTFTLLLKKDPLAEPERKPSNTEKMIAPKKKVTTLPKPATQETKTTTTKTENVGPSLNINVQVHISSDATPDQIDQIFQSMAKHIYNKD